MRLKRNLIILGIILLFLMSLTASCSAQSGDSNTEVTPMMYFFIFGSAVSVISLFIMNLGDFRLGLFTFIVGLMIMVLTGLFLTNTIVIG